jgi:hypothetical protein
MLRRDFLAAAAAAPVIPSFLRKGWNYGLVKAPGHFVKKARCPYFSQWNRRIRGTGKGKVIMLHKYLEQVTGLPLIPRDQEIGDCVGQGYALGVDLLTATQIAMCKRPEKWMAPASPEIIYGGSRIECGPGKDEFYDPRRNRYFDGSCGEWAAQFVLQYGVLLAKQYPGYDLTNYSGERSRAFGIDGVPDALEPLAKEHPVRTISLVRTWDELIDALANGYPVPLCSNLGFGSGWSGYVRDSQGFMTRTPQYPWWHCMTIIGYDDASSRRGACVANSWGGVFTGGTQHGQPPTCSFWIDKVHIEEALREHQDSYALSCYVGYPRIVIPDARFF